MMYDDDVTICPMFEKIFIFIICIIMSASTLFFYSLLLSFGSLLL